MPGAETSAFELPDYVRRLPSGLYRSLSPLTKLTIAAAEAVVALGVRGWTGPLVVLACVLASAAVASVLRRIVPFALAALPLVASILLVNTFLYPNAHDEIGRFGPLAPTWTGATAALQATLRVVSFGLSAAVFALTTPTNDLLVDLERRGLGRRGSYVVGSALEAVPRTVGRAREVAEAQRARGLDTQGSIRRRIGGILPVVGPVVFGALSEVEQRTMALEARGFTAPGPRTQLRALPDSRLQKLSRWTLLGLSLAAAAISVTGAVTVP